MTSIIGTRLSYRQMQESLGRPVSHINQKFSKTLRKVAMDKGIKQTEQGARLEFYIVTDEEYSQFTTEGNDMILKLAGKEPVRALISIDNDLMSENLNKVNSKPEYQGGMNYDVHQRYLSELRKAMADAVHKIGEDQNTRKKADAVGENPYKVGDYVYSQYLKKFDGETEGGVYWFARARVRKSGKRFVELEIPLLGGHEIWSNTESAKQVFNDVITWGMEHCKYAGDPHGHFVPEASNKESIRWVPITRGYTDKPQKMRWDRVPGTTLERATELAKKHNGHVLGAGYVYNYEGCRD